MTVKVYVINKNGRNLVLRYKDPETRRDIDRTSNTTNKRDAEKAAILWEQEINSGKFARGSATTWASFLQKFKAEHLAGLKPTTASKYNTTLERFTKIVNPRRVSGITPSQIQSFLARLRKDGLEETSISSYATHLKAALNWAYAMEMIPQKIAVPKVQRAKKFAGTPMKGRPLTEEEFQRFLEATPAVISRLERGTGLVAPSGKTRKDLGIVTDPKEWQFYFTGMWLSGLRLAESLDFWWDRQDRLHLYNGMLRIYSENEKGNTDRLLPLTPDFTEFLNHVPKSQRTGRVFKVVPHFKTADTTISRIASSIGEEADIVVNPKTGKFASLHDFRRSFGDRWAMRVEATILMQLMRHENITTTLRYYVGRDARRLMDSLCGTFGGTPKPSSEK